MPLLKLNPVTRKRLQRFRRIKRSYWSMWLLVALYGFGMLADVLFNDKPLYLRYEGQSYFPLFFYYPDKVFTNSGLGTRPDYKALAKSARFADTDGNFMIFPLYPFGPNESVTAEEIDIDDSIELRIERALLVATLDVNAQLDIRRSLAGAGLVGAQSDRALRGRALGDFLELPSPALAAIEGRFANREALPELRLPLALASGRQVELSLPPFEPRSRDLRTTRLTLREMEGEAQAAQRLRFSPEGELLETAAIWEELDEDLKLRLREAVQRRIEHPVQPLSFTLGGASYEAYFDKEDIFFPFRPTSRHWMGLDSSGRDVFSRLVYALRISMNFGILLVLASMSIGIVAGGLQGYLGGKVDLLAQRGIEVWEAMPFLYVMILMGSVFGKSFAMLLLVYALFSWIGMSYYMRGEFLKLRKQPFVEAARCLGLPSRAIMLRHILPNALVPVVTFFPFSLVSAIGALSALDYLGFGMPAPTPSWGELFAQAQEFRFAWWLVLYPFIALFGVGLLGVFVGEGVRAAFDPRANTRYES